MIKRRKPVDISQTSARQLCEKHKFDPFEEMILCVKNRIPVPRGVDPDVLKPMLQRYDLVEEDGKQWLVLPVKDKLDALDKCCRYTRPVLKSSEIKDVKDYTLRVTVKKFGEVENGNGTVVDVTPEIVPLLEEKHGPEEST